VLSSVKEWTLCSGLQTNRRVLKSQFGEKKLDSVFVNYLCSTEEKITRIGFFRSTGMSSVYESLKFHGC